MNDDFRDHRLDFLQRGVALSRLNKQNNSRSRFSLPNIMSTVFNAAAGIVIGAVVAATYETDIKDMKSFASDTIQTLKETIPPSPPKINRGL